MMNYDYQIADIRFRCCMPFPLNITAESRPFVLPPDGREPDLIFTFRPVTALSRHTASENWIENRLYEQTPAGERVYFRQFPGAQPYARVFRDERGTLQCDYLAGTEHLMNRARNIVDLLSLETLLLHHRGFLLHAAFVRWQGKAILFSGPSGIGKSTQAALWQEHCGSDIINGDRAAVRSVRGQWTAWGLPYAGTSGIYRNESAPVAAVVMLQQASSNRIRPLSAAEAFRLLYPQVTIHRWDAEFTRQAADRILELTQAVPVYLLECRPDTEAADLLRRTLTKGD